MMKHYFFLVMNKKTFKTYYKHAGADKPEELKEFIDEDEEKILTAWEASAESISMR